MRITCTLLLYLFVIVLNVPCCSATPNKSDVRQFTTVAHAVIRSLRHDNWLELKPYCATQVVIEEQFRVYRNGQSGQTLLKVFPADIFSQTDILGDGDNEVELYAHESLVVNVAKPLGAGRAAFGGFCSAVAASYTWDVPPVEIGLNVHSYENDTQFGPAIYGKVASNYKWRVSFERIGGRWRVRRLSLEGH
jgi:hypothetical protein